MHLAAITLSALLAIGFAAQAPASVASSTPAALPRADDVALVLVHKFQLGRTLERMANRLAQRTQTYYMVGPVRVVMEIHRLAPKYQMQWDANLAKALAAHLSPAEMASLAQQGGASPYVAKMRAQWPAIEKDTHAGALPIMQALVTEALQHTVR